MGKMEQLYDSLKSKFKTTGGYHKMIIFGDKNYQELSNSLIIPGVSIRATKYWFLPIYRITIRYTN